MKKILVILVVLLLVPLSISAQDACEGNFDCDTDVDGTDASVFKEDFGRSAFKNSCPMSDDCCYGTLSPLGRWCDQGNGTVKDMTTGLVWLKKADWGGLLVWISDGYPEGAHRRVAQLWDGSPDAVDAELSDGSLEGDWSLPSRNELYNLMNGTEPVSSDNMQFFTGIQPSEYWTCASLPAGGALVCNMLYGGCSITSRYNNYYWLLPVRNPQ